MIRTFFIRSTSFVGVVTLLVLAVGAFRSYSTTASTTEAMTATQQPPAKQVFGNPSKTLTPGIMVGNTLFISGQLGTSGKADGVAGETKASIEAAEKVLKMAAMELTDVVMVTAYLVDVNDFGAFNTAYTAAFTTAPRPTRTTVIVKELVNQAKVELTMTAVKAR